tara:strand:+ start:591 stop:1004 length:414 start_codon:yes stop_codon:yes gene_type:complete
MFFKKKNKNQNNKLEKIAALLIYAAKIDENFTEQEEQIIELTLKKIGTNNEKIKKIIKDAKIIEENSNQILEFTKEVKNMNEKDKISIIEALWKIIYSNKEADIYETNLMRRLAGLLYIDNKTMNDIKDKIKKENSS